MFQFLFLSAWAWLNSTDVNGKCVLITKTGAANLPAANTTSYITLSMHNPPPNKKFSLIPEDLPPLKLEIALQRDANVVHK